MCGIPNKSAVDIQWDIYKFPLSRKQRRNIAISFPPLSGNLVFCSYLNEYLVSCFEIWHEGASVYMLKDPQIWGGKC